ncbi:YybS family protein [Alkaliphilus serpentinus]|uniref:YybS family protein n=1 Tax=Alkaliphilus serpentinus TaxID=1482731 RepID=UPI0018657333|nr:YybS family protein [Alkaliphilus serpentinus]
MNLENNKRALIESALIAMISAFFAISVIYIPVLSILIFFLPVPFIILSARRGTKYTILSLLISSLAIGLLTELILTGFILIMFGPVALVIGYCIRTKKEPFTAISIASALWVVTTFLIIQLIAIIGGINFMEIIADSFKEVQLQMEEILSMEYSKATIKAAIDNLIMLIPSFLILQSVMGAFANYYLAISVLKKIRYDYDKLPEFSKFRLPGNILLGSFIIFVLSYLTRFIEGIHFNALLNNVIVIFIFVFYLQGIATISYMLKRIKTPKALRIFLIILIVVFSPLTAYIIAPLGLIDAAFDIRKLRSIKKQ